MRISVIKGFRCSEIDPGAKKYVKEISNVMADGAARYTAVSEAGCRHVRVVTRRRLGLLDYKASKWTNPMIGSVKTNLRGSY